MQIRFRKLSFLLSIVLVFQLIVPMLSVFAAETFKTPPTNLTVTIYNVNDVYLKWNGVSGASGYRIYKIVDNNKELFGETTKNVLYKSYVAEGSYTFAVSALYGTEESVLSSSVNVEIVYPEIKAPSGLNSTIYEGNDLYLQWTAAENATTYNIYQVVDGQRKLVTTTNKTNKYISYLAEASYVYEVTTVSDRFGESETGSKLLVDIVYPEIQPPTGLKSTIYNGNDVYLQWTAIENATKYNIYQVVDGVRNLVATTNKTNQYFSQLAEGDYLYEVTTVSDRFGESETGSQILVELVYPKIQPPIGVNSTIYNGNDLYLQWTASEHAAKYNIYQLIDGVRNLVATTSRTSQYLSYLAEGPKVYEITTISDRFGESELGNQIQVDILYPKIKPPTELQSTVYNGNDLYLQWKAAEYAVNYNIYLVEDGIRKLVATTNKTSYYFSQLAEGKYLYEVTTVSDRFGESNEVSKVTSYIGYPEIKAPVLELEMVERNAAKISWDMVEYADTYYIYKILEGESVKVGTATSNVYYASDLADGFHEFVVKSVNERFGESPYSNNVIAEVKQKLPAPAVDEPTVEDDDVTLSWDEVEGAASYNVYQEVDGKKVLVATTTEPTFTFNDLEAGNHEFYIVPVAESGFEGSESTTVIVITEESDVTPPVTSSNIEDKWLHGSFNMVLTATDDKSGVAKTLYSVNGSEFVEGNSFIVSDEGVNEISFYSIDKAGNVEVVQTVEVKIDDTPPVTTSNVSDNWLKKSFLVELSATDNVSGVEMTYYSVNGSEFVRGTRFVVSEPGVNKVSFFSVDFAGNVEEVKTVEVKIDENAPETVSNVTDQWFVGEVAFQLSATDDLSGVAQTFYSINGSAFAEGTTYTVTDEGVNEVSFFSVDNAGNVEEVKIVEVKIDKAAPETTSNVTDQWNQGEVAVELTATDDLSGVAQTFYSINGSEYVEGTTFTVTEEGINEVSFYSVDNAGNVEDAKSVEVKIDKTAPTLSIEIEKEQELGSTFALDYTAEDNLSGIAVEEVTFNGKTYQKGDKVTFDQSGKLVVTVTDAAGWTTQVEKEIVVYISADLEVLPKVIKGNKGIFTVKAILPTVYQDVSFDVSSVILNGVEADPKNNGLQKQAEKGHFKFEREDFDWEKGEVTLELRGYLENGVLVIARKTVEVK